MQNQYTITKHALATLLAGDEENSSNTILGLGSLFSVIDNAVLSLFSLAVSSLGADNYSYLTPENITEGHNADDLGYLFRTCYKSEGKKKITKYLGCLKDVISDIRKSISFNRGMFSDAEYYLKKYYDVINSSRVLHLSTNNHNLEDGDGVLEEDSFNHDGLVRSSKGIDSEDLSSGMNIIESEDSIAKMDKVDAVLGDNMSKSSSERNDKIKSMSTDPNAEKVRKAKFLMNVSIV